MSTTVTGHVKRYVYGPEVNYLGTEAYPHYSFCDITQAGNTLYCSGVTPTRGVQDGTNYPYNLEVVSAGDFRGQYDWVLGTLGRMLVLAGAQFPRDVVNVTVMCTDMQALNGSVDIWAKHFGDAWPALTYMQVTALYHPEQMVEANAIAVIGDN
ncbi:RidA family protein [Mycobacterium sp. E1747]|uniref:RidA family protein n=1 Tax=Mycobacterium sp. E1747 TaxID=1834128 RepID=UPI0007FE60D6|nr:RidA family protein [Mycobacterium sp. E1747]OBH11393.1 hypothetical protein A5695_19115 [Mycobacterium sp. E1747]